MRATWRVVYNRHTGANPHIPNAGAMDDHANRVLAYMAQHAHEGIELKTQGGSQLIAYSDSDWA
eukprot:6207905-Pleurochrysis_carterae.AAC.1